MNFRIAIIIVILGLMIRNISEVFFLNDIFLRKEEYYITHRAIILKFPSKKYYELFLLPFIILLINIILALVSVILLIITKNDIIGVIIVTIFLIYTVIVTLIVDHYFHKKW